jgi:thiosulfate dehydrogenase [quinone] large subunit
MAAVLLLELPSESRKAATERSAAAFCWWRFAPCSIAVWFAVNQGRFTATGRSFSGRLSPADGGLHPMSNSTIEKNLIFYFRMTMAWTFLYAASHQVFVPSFSVVGFLQRTKTFHDLFAVFTTPAMAPITTFLVEYGHLLIGLSLLTGLMVRVSAAFGIMLMGIYWLAHMDWPFIENTNNLIVDYHLVYAGVLAYLIVKRAGHVWGLDAWAENLQFIKQNPALKPLVA